MNSLCFVIVVLLSSIAIVCSQQDGSKHLKVDDKHKSPQLYVFGGRDMRDNGVTLIPTASHYNSSTAEWKSTTKMAVGKENSCGVVVGTKIYLFGGESDAGIVETVEVYDTETGVYSPYRSMPGPRRDCAAAVLNDHIYVAGGLDDSSRLSSVFRYDIQTTRLEDVSSMHTARADPQLVELGGLLYAIGGWNDIKTVEVYNATTDRWRMVASTKNAHYYSGATVHEGKIYVISANGFEVYSPETDEWDTLTSPPNSYQGRPLVLMDGKLWTVGGGVPGTDKGTKSVLTYNISTKKWSEQAEMDAARKFHTAFVVNH